LAAYNCGPGHVIDGRRLAKDMKLDPNKWFKNVEKAMMELMKPAVAKHARHGYFRATETVAYVSEIQTRYDSYSTLVDLEEH
jgi:membrane-bound lytic murein transglycosylase F